MAQQFTRYVGYDSPEAFRGFLMDSYAAARKRGLFFTDRLAMASTTEISAAAPYTAASYDDPAAIKQGLDAWLRSVHITCDSAAIAQVMVKALAECGVNKKNTYFVILCWLMKFLAAKPSLFVFVGAANLRELYLMYMLSLAGVEVTLVSYGADADFARFPYRDGITVKGGSNTAPITVDYASIDLTKQEQLSQMRQSQQRVSGLVKQLETTAAGIFEDFMTDRKTRVVRSGGVFTEDGEIPVYCAALIGYDDDAAYTNMLVKFKESFAGSKKQLIFIEPQRRGGKGAGRSHRDKYGRHDRRAHAAYKAQRRPHPHSACAGGAQRGAAKPQHGQQNARVQLRLKACYVALPLHAGAQVLRAVRGYPRGALLRRYFAVGGVLPEFYVALRV